jgi:hypothetical protein
MQKYFFYASLIFYSFKKISFIGKKNAFSVMSKYRKKFGIFLGCLSSLFIKTFKNKSLHKSIKIFYKSIKVYESLLNESL